MAQTRHPRPDHGVDSLVKVLKMFQGVPSSFGSGMQACVDLQHARLRALWFDLTFDSTNVRLHVHANFFVTFLSSFANTPYGGVYTAR